MLKPFTPVDQESGVEWPTLIWFTLHTHVHLPGGSAVLVESELVGGLVPVEEVVQLQTILSIFSTAKCVVELLGINMRAQTIFLTNEL